jgi:hypothetical protein
LVDLCCSSLAQVSASRYAILCGSLSYLHASLSHDAVQVRGITSGLSRLLSDEMS